MARHVTASVVRVADKASTRLSMLSPGAAVCGTLVVFAAFLWIITIASAAISFALTVALAIAWCVWLERHPAPAA
jgi:hypothetical protein